MMIRKQVGFIKNLPIIKNDCVFVSQTNVLLQANILYKYSEPRMQFYSTYGNLQVRQSELNVNYLQFVISIFQDSLYIIMDTNYHLLNYLLILSFLISATFTFGITNETYTINLTDPKQPVISFAVNRDASVIAAISLDNRIYVYKKDTENPNTYRIIEQLIDATKPLSSIDFSENIDYIITGGFDSCIFVYQKNIEQHSLRDKVCGSSMIFYVEYLEETHEVIAAQLGGDIKLYTIKDGKLTEKHKINGGSNLLAVQATESRQNLVAAGNQMPVSVYQYDGTSFHLVQNLTQNSFVSRSVSISSDGYTVAFTNPNRCIIVYKKVDNTYEHIQEECPKDSQPDQCYLTSDGKYLFGFSNIEEIIYVYEFQQSTNRYGLIQEIQKDAFVQGIKYLMISDDLTHLVVALADSADQVTNEQEPKVAILTQKVDTTNYTNQLHWLIIVAIVLGAVLIVMFVAFLMYKKLRLDNREKNYNESIGSATSTIGDMNVVQQPNQIQPDIITGTVPPQ